MALCPGFTKTEFHERMDVGRGSAPDFMWLDADKLVATALADFDKGRVYSIPGAQYKVIATASRLMPTPCCSGSSRWAASSRSADVTAGVTGSHALRCAASGPARSAARTPRGRWCCSRARGRACRCRGGRWSR